jgi:hypothetical protein
LLRGVNHCSLKGPASERDGGTRQRNRRAPMPRSRHHPFTPLVDCLFEITTGRAVVAAGELVVSSRVDWCSFSVYSRA